MEHNISSAWLGWQNVQLNNWTWIDGQICKYIPVNWSLPVIQTEEAHQSLVRFMVEHNISSAWLGWQNVKLKNWTWIDGQICKYIPVNWSLPVIQTEEAHQSLVRFMMEHNISSAWLGWQNVQLNNWTWINGQICKYIPVNWSLPVIQTEEAHQSLVRFMMEHNISSAWLGWQNVQLNNWTWINGQICKYIPVNWSLPVIQTEEAHQSLVRFMMEHNISSAWLGWQNVQLNNWTWIDGQICK